MPHEPRSRPPPPLYLTRLLVAARCGSFFRVVITTVPPHARPQIGPRVLLANPALSPVNSQSPSRAPTQAVCLNYQISRKARCTSLGQSARFPPSPAKSSEPCPPKRESAHPS